jgi:hypothetical protein
MLQIFNDRYAVMRICWFALTIVFAPAVAASEAAPAAEYNSEWGPAIGSMLPLLEAPDQTGQVRQLDDLAGEQGLLLFLNRSADW